MNGARIGRHPIHPMLVGFPIAFYTGGVASLIAYSVNADPFWLRLSITLLVAGVIGGPVTGVTPDIGMAVLVPSFLVVVIGGMGSLPGAVLSGLILGEAVSLSVLIYPPSTQIIIYLVAAVVLLWRPRGLMGVKGVAE